MNYCNSGSLMFRMLEMLGWLTGPNGRTWPTLLLEALHAKRSRLLDFGEARQIHEARCHWNM